MARMSIRSWFRKQGEQADADAVKRAEEEAVESSAERSQGDRWDQGAVNRVSGRIGERPDDIGRLGDFNP
jgi:hypothetical protein